MEKWLNYHHLYYFKIIAESGSISKAAEKLRLGQPTLSAQLKLLEDSLNTLLFDRSNKRLILTEQGLITLDYARNIFKLGHELIEVLNDTIAPEKTHIQIGALDSISKNVIVQISKFISKKKNSQLSLVEGKADELIRELKTHQIDIVVTDVLPSPSQLKGLKHKLIAHSPIGIYGTRKFKGLKKKFPTSLHNIPLIVPTSNSRLRADIEHIFRHLEIQINIMAETQDISLKKIMATESLGLIPAANHSVKKQLNTHELFEIGSFDSIFEDLYLISASRHRENPLSTLIMKEFSLDF